MKNSTRLTIIILLIVPMVPRWAHAQDEHFLYGRITMTDSKVYEGPIRWGKEEVYWNDIFNASKPRNQNLRHLTSDERDNLIERLHDYNHRHDDWNHWGRW